VFWGLWFGVKRGRQLDKVKVSEEQLKNLVEMLKREKAKLVEEMDTAQVEIVSLSEKIKCLEDVRLQVEKEAKLKKSEKLGKNVLEQNNREESAPSSVDMNELPEIPTENNNNNSNKDSDELKKMKKLLVDTYNNDNLLWAHIVQLLSNVQEHFYNDKTESCAETGSVKDDQKTNSTTVSNKKSYKHMSPQMFELVRAQLQSNDNAHDFSSFEDLKLQYMEINKEKIKLSRLYEAEKSLSKTNMI